MAYTYGSEKKRVIDHITMNIQLLFEQLDNNIYTKFEINVPKYAFGYRDKCSVEFKLFKVDGSVASKLFEDIDPHLMGLTDAINGIRELMASLEHNPITITPKPYEAARFDYVEEIFGLYRDQYGYFYMIIPNHGSKWNNKHRKYDDTIESYRFVSYNQYSNESGYVQSCYHPTRETGVIYGDDVDDVLEIVATKTDLILKEIENFSDYGIELQDVESHLERRNKVPEEPQYSSSSSGWTHSWEEPASWGNSSSWEDEVGLGSGFIGTGFGY